MFRRKKGASMEKKDDSPFLFPMTILLLVISACFLIYNLYFYASNPEIMRLVVLGFAGVIAVLLLELRTLLKNKAQACSKKDGGEEEAEE